MNDSKRFVAILAIVVAAYFPAKSHAQSTTEVFGAVSAVVTLFAKLNAQFDDVVRYEGRGQLRRSVDRLRKDLYALEADARILAENTPDQAPHDERRARLDQLAQELQETVRSLTQTTRELGAELTLNEADQVEEALVTSLRGRAIKLNDLRQALVPEPGAVWNGAKMRDRMLNGVRAIKSAQLEVTRFSAKLGRGQ